YTTLFRSRVHPVVADVAAAVEILADNDTVAAADRFFGFESCVPYGHHPLVDVQIISDDGLLARRFGGRHLDGRNRMRDGMRQPARALLRIIPTEEVFDDVHFGVQVRHAFQVRIPFDIFE